MKEQIEEMARKICGNHHNGDCVGGECICQYECIYAVYANRLYNAGYRKQEWIRVDDRLPEDVYGKDRKQITVLVCTESGKVSTTSRQRIVKWDKTKLEYVELDTFEWSKRKRVTHWMPLPEPPKMKGGAE